MAETGSGSAAPPARAPRWAEDAGVSPVVGMILVLAISVSGIAATVYWGLPAIDEMKANVEFRNVESQFNELDATTKELVAGTTQRTAKRWLPSISRGDIALHNETEAWLFATETHNATANSLAWAGFKDGDNVFVVKNVGPADLHWVKVEAYKVRGSSEDQLNVSMSAASNAQMSGASLQVWPMGEEQRFYIQLKDRPSNEDDQNIAQAVFHFKVFTGPDLVAEAWYMETGVVEYTLNAGLGNKAVVANNGAVITGVNGAYTVENTPPIPPPSTAASTHRFFGRAVVFDGDIQFAGIDRFDALLSLYSTSTLASYDCAEADKSDCVLTSKLFIYGDYQSPWYVYLTNQNLGYDYVERTETFTTYTSESVKYLEDRQAQMAYTLLQSTITFKGGA